MGWQWHQLDHMPIIDTSLQTDNHATISPLSFYRPDALPAGQPTALGRQEGHPACTNLGTGNRSYSQADYIIYYVTYNDVGIETTACIHSTDMIQY